MPKVCLPLMQITQTDGVITSVDQVFNGFGYIGSTIFVDKGVKGLIPNGRNKDGTLNNIEFVTGKVLTRTFNTTENCVFALSGTAISKTSLESYAYKEIENFNYSGSGTWNCCAIGSFTLTNGVISNFNTKLPFRAVDYNELKSYIVETYVNRTSWYNLYSNGWIEQGGKIVVNSAGVGGGNYSTATLTFMKPFSKLMSWHCQARHDRFNAGFNLTTVGDAASSVAVYQVNDSGATFTNEFVLWQASGYIA
jgi:hypothetical protein